MYQDGSYHLSRGQTSIESQILQNRGSDFRNGKLFLFENISKKTVAIITMQQRGQMFHETPRCAVGNFSREIQMIAISPSFLLLVGEVGVMQCLCTYLRMPHKSLSSQEWHWFHNPPASGFSVLGCKLSPLIRNTDTSNRPSRLGLSKDFLFF